VGTEWAGRLTSINGGGPLGLHFEGGPLKRPTSVNPF
jgi:hypothetical protein